MRNNYSTVCMRALETTLNVRSIISSMDNVPEDVKEIGYSDSINNSISVLRYVRQNKITELSIDIIEALENIGGYINLLFEHSYVDIRNIDKQNNSNIEKSLKSVHNQISNLTATYYKQNPDSKQKIDHFNYST